MRKVLMICSALLLVSSAAAPAQQAKGRQILETAREKYMERMADVRDFWLREEVMGFEGVTYYERKEESEFPRYEKFSMNGGESSESGHEFYEKLEELFDYVEYVGTEDVDGHECYVVAVKDLAGLGVLDGAGVDDFKTAQLQIALDVKHYVLRKLVIDGTAHEDGEEKSMTMILRMRDYRVKEKMMHPYMTTITIKQEGMEPSDDELAEARAELQELKDALEAVEDEEEREMLEQKIDFFQSMITDRGLTIPVRVTDMGVNEGRPAVEQEEYEEEYEIEMAE